jgi:hypothetical protein
VDYQCSGGSGDRPRHVLAVEDKERSGRIVATILYTANAINTGLGNVVDWLTLLSTSVILLGGPKPRWLNREAAVWAHYSATTFILWLHASLDNDGYPFALLALAVAVGVILNHPVLQALGWVVGTVYALQALQFAYRDEFGPHIQYVIWYLFFAFFGGFGLVSAGHALRKYRVYINYYIKRIWRALRSAVSDHPLRQRSAHNRAVVSARDNTGPDADLTKNLLD